MLVRSLTPVTSLSMLPGIRSLAVAIHLEIHRVYIFARRNRRGGKSNKLVTRVDDPLYRIIWYIS
ncbi:hypothetical protein C6H68_17690 [Photorhabdus luminescens]|nr:hypothetical protein C6H68_17690 [Photorhabdus luminescens]